MSDTPRTDAEEFYPHDSQNKVCYASFCRQLERELNAALKRIDFVMDCNADVKRIAMERNKAIERIKHLEEELMESKNKYSALVADVVHYRT